MTGVDTNILVYSTRTDSVWHDKALELVRTLVEGTTPWAIPWSCVHEFVATVTRPRYFNPPSTYDEALGAVASWLESSSLRLFGEGPGYWGVFSRLVRSARLAGPRIHDARIAAICLSHGVSRFWMADCDFALFPELKWANPFIRL